MHRLCPFQRRAVYFLKGRWRISPVTAADPLRTRRVGASDPSKGMSFIHLDRNLEQMLIPDKAARKLIEIANSVEAVQDGRIHIEKINEPFLRAGGSPTEYVAGLELAITKGWLWKHESGVYVKFTPAGAELFA